MTKKILVVDDSALMRRVLCDIIGSDERFEVADRARDGQEALDLLRKNSYDAVVLDVNMPRMNGLQLLYELRKARISARIMMASTDTREGAKTTLDALELGALDFVHKPDNAVSCRVEDFRREFLKTLAAVADSRQPVLESPVQKQEVRATTRKIVEIARKHGAGKPEDCSYRQFHRGAEISAVGDYKASGRTPGAGADRSAHAQRLYRFTGRPLGLSGRDPCEGGGRG